MEAQTAHVLAFPLYRRVDLVRETADSLNRRQGEAANRFWKTTVNRLVAHLHSVGVIDRCAVEIEIELFLRAVLEELEALADVDQSCPTGGGEAA